MWFMTVAVRKKEKRVYKVTRNLCQCAQALVTELEGFLEKND